MFFFIFKNCYVLSLQRVFSFPGLTSCFISHDTRIPSAAFLSFVFLNCCPFIPFSQKLWYPQMNILWEVVVWSVQSLVIHGASNLNAVLLLTHSRTGFVYVPAESHCRLLLDLKSSIKVNKNNPKESRSLRGVFCQVIASLPWACAINSSLRSWATVRSALEVFLQVELFLLLTFFPGDSPERPWQQLQGRQALGVEELHITRLDRSFWFVKAGSCLCHFLCVSYASIAEILYFLNTKKNLCTFLTFWKIVQHI